TVWTESEGIDVVLVAATEGILPDPGSQVPDRQVAALGANREKPRVRKTRRGGPVARTAEVPPEGQCGNRQFALLKRKRRFTVHGRTDDHFACRGPRRNQQPIR